MQSRPAWVSGSERCRCAVYGYDAVKESRVDFNRLVEADRVISGAAPGLSLTLYDERWCISNLYNAEIEPSDNLV